MRPRPVKGGASSWPTTGSTFLLGDIAVAAGEYENAAAHHRRFCELCRRGSANILSTYAPRLGRSLCALGRDDEAEPLAELGRTLDETGKTSRPDTLAAGQALVHASRGEHAEAEALAREAVAITEPTDALNIQGEALTALAEVLHPPAGPDEAAATLAQALGRYERKHNLAHDGQHATASPSSKLRRPETQADAAPRLGVPERLTDCAGEAVATSAIVLTSLTVATDEARAGRGARARAIVA